MKIQKFCCLLLGLLLLLSFAACSPEELPPETTPIEPVNPPVDESLPEWTFIFYASFCDLSLIGNNIEAIVEAPLTDDINVLLQVGGGYSEGFHKLNYTINDTTYLTYETHRFIKNAEGTTHLAKLDGARQPSVNTLADCLTYAKENYPAKKYALILSGHGTGTSDNLLPDVVRDTSTAVYDTGLSINGLTRAIDFADLHFETIIFDTCLMGKIETVQALKPYTNYLSFSETETLAAGLNYKAIFEELTAHPEHNGATLGEKIVSSYIEISGEDDLKKIASYATVDLSKEEALSAAFDALFAEANRTPETYTSVLRSIVTATETSRGKILSRDVVSFCDNLQNEGVLVPQAEALKAAVQSATLSKDQVATEPSYCGLAFVFPPEYLEDLRLIDAYVLNTRGNESYIAFLDAVMADWEAPAWVYEKVPYNRTLVDSDYTLSLHSEKDEDKKNFVVLDGGRAVLDTLAATLYTASAADATETQMSTFMTFPLSLPESGNKITVSLPAEILAWDNRPLHLQLQTVGEDTWIYQINGFIFSGEYNSKDLLVDYDPSTGRFGVPYAVGADKKRFELSELSTWNIALFQKDAQGNEKVLSSQISFENFVIDRLAPQNFTFFASFTATDFFGRKTILKRQALSLPESTDGPTTPLTTHSYEDVPLFLPDYDFHIEFTVDGTPSLLSCVGDTLYFFDTVLEYYFIFESVDGEYVTYCSEKGDNWWKFETTVSAEDIWDIVFPVPNFFLGPLDGFTLTGTSDDGTLEIYKDAIGSIRYYDVANGRCTSYEYQYEYANKDAHRTYVLTAFETENITLPEFSAD